MADGPSLADLQRAFHALVTSGAPIGPALARLDPRFVHGDTRLDAAGRIEIYADMYLARLVDALAEDFPTLARLLGESGFERLCADFLAARPPPDFSLRHLGQALPAFVATRAVSPWYADLARLEWARADLFDRADVPLLTLAHLRGRPPERFASLTLQAIPAHELVDTAFPIDELWRRGGAGDAPSDLTPTPGRVLVWRREARVLHRRVASPEAELLPLLATGVAFGALCDRLGADRAPEEAGRLAFELVGAWLADELLVRVEGDDDDDDDDAA